MILQICKLVTNIINKKVQEIIVVCGLEIYTHNKYQVPNKIHKLQKLLSSPIKYVQNHILRTTYKC